MKKRDNELILVEGNHPITKQSDPLFYKNLQRGLILALKDRGILSEEDFSEVMEQTES